MSNYVLSITCFPENREECLSQSKLLFIDFVKKKLPFHATHPCRNLFYFRMQSLSLLEKSENKAGFVCSSQF